MRFPRPEDGLRAVAAHAPQAEAFAALWITRIRPFAVHVYALRRRIATVAVVLLAASLFVHVMFGANGMVVYKTKRAEYQKLQTQIEQLHKENEHYEQQVKALQSDPKTIEKEAREQLHYAKPGEVVYVDPEPPKPDQSSAKK